jgi:hypothetical protein
LTHYRMANAATARPSVSARFLMRSMTIPTRNISARLLPSANFTMRMSMRRFTRLINAFSKKVENHAHAVAIHMMYYNFVRIHKTLRVTPAMAAGVTEKLWDVSDIVAVLEKWEAANRGGLPYCWPYSGIGTPSSLIARTQIRAGSCSPRRYT